MIVVSWSYAQLLHLCSLQRCEHASVWFLPPSQTGSRPTADLRRSGCSPRTPTPLHSAAGTEGDKQEGEDEEQLMNVHVHWCGRVINMDKCCSVFYLEDQLPLWPSRLDCFQSLSFFEQALSVFNEVNDSEQPLCENCSTLNQFALIASCWTLPQRNFTKSRVTFVGSKLQRADTELRCRVLLWMMNEWLPAHDERMSP